MKAVYGYVRQVKKHLTTGEAIVEVQIPAEGYKEAVQLLDCQPVFVTLAGDVKGGYGVVDSEEPEQTEPEPPKQKFTELRPSAQAAILCKEKGFRDFFLPHERATEDDCADFVRANCSVKSRADLDVRGRAQDKWREMENRYYCSRYPEQM